MNDHIYADILQHLHMCLNLVKLFKGREEIIEKVTSYLKGICLRCSTAKVLQ